jgi:beta-galactosidase
MKRIVILSSILTSCIFIFICFFNNSQIFAASDEYPEWNNNPEVFHINREEAHSSLFPYSNEKEALHGDYEESKNYLSLNGQWKFNLSENPDSRPEDFYMEDYDVELWDEIKVPGNWQTQGFDYPIYVNIQYPWTGIENPSPPYAPTIYNPVGSYKTTFEINKNWNKKQVYLSFQGVESAFYVWINGNLVGYSEDSYTTKDFDVTEYLKEGTNSIAVEVYRWSDGSWLEDQDFIRLSGIFRDVYLYATPKTHISDFEITTDLDSDYKDATMTVEAQVSSEHYNSLKNYKVEAKLFDTKNNKVLKTPVILNKESQNSDTIFLKGEVEIKNPLKWTAETPNLYKVVLNLKNKYNKVVESETGGV